MSLTRKRQFAGKSIHKYTTIAKLFSVKDQPHLLIPRKPAGVLVGRSSTCDIRITGLDISSRHCQFSLSSNSVQEFLMLTDLSSNGTSVNGEVLGRGTTVLLRSGDKISFAKSGTYIFRYMHDTERRSFFDDYILMGQLGSGHYAVVNEARDRTSGDIVAVKIFHPSKTGAPEDDKLRQEMEVLLSISHPNIVRFILHYVEPISEVASTTYLVLEKVNSGELFQRIVTKLKFREPEARAIFTQLLEGLFYLHERSIIHRDIKPENILLDITPRESPAQVQTGPWDDHEYDVRVKIADFGLAKFIGELKFTNTLCGTPAYVAPEVLNNNRNYTTKVDVWLAGVLLYVCLCGFPPFSDELGPPSMRDQILQGKYAFYLPFWDNISDSALDLISNLLVVDPSQRYTVGETRAHYWFRGDVAQEPLLSSSDTVATASQRSLLRSNTQPVTLHEKYSDLFKENREEELSGF